MLYNPTFQAKPLSASSLQDQDDDTIPARPHCGRDLNTQLGGYNMSTLFDII